VSGIISFYVKSGDSDWNSLLMPRLWNFIDFFIITLLFSLSNFSIISILSGLGAKLPLSGGKNIPLLFSV